MVVGLPAPLQSVANSSLLIGILSLQLIFSKVTNGLRLGLSHNLGSSTSCRAQLDIVGLCAAQLVTRVTIVLPRFTPGLTESTIRQSCDQAPLLECLSACHAPSFR